MTRSGVEGEKRPSSNRIRLGVTVSRFESSQTTTFERARKQIPELREWGKRGRKKRAGEVST